MPAKISKIIYRPWRLLGSKLSNIEFLFFVLLGIQSWWTTAPEAHGFSRRRRRDEHTQDHGNRADCGRHPGATVRQVQLHQGDSRHQAGPARDVGCGKADGQRPCLGRRVANREWWG